MRTSLDPRRGLVRGVRAAVLTLPTVGLSGAAHSSVDHCVDVTGLLLTVGLCWPAAVAMLGARRRLPAFLAWVLGAQLLTHLVLEATCGAAGQLLPPHTLVAHGLAAVVTAVLLHRADAGLWVTRTLLRWLLPVAPQAIPVPSLAGRAWPACRRTVRRSCPRSPRVLRGPPSSAMR